MNLRLLKFIVIFMGIIIVFGVLSLGVVIYYKFKNLTNNTNEKTLLIASPKQMQYLKHKITSDQIFISYENAEKILIKIFNINNGKFTKQIEILK